MKKYLFISIISTLILGFSACGDPVPGDDGPGTGPGTDPGTPSADSRLVDKIGISHDGELAYNFTFDYDAQNRVTKIEDSDGELTIEFSYSAGKLTMTMSEEYYDDPSYYTRASRTGGITRATHPAKRGGMSFGRLARKAAAKTRAEEGYVLVKDVYTYSGNLNADGYVTSLIVSWKMFIDGSLVDSDSGGTETYAYNNGYLSRSSGEDDYEDQDGWWADYYTWSGGNLTKIVYDGGEGTTPADVPSAGAYYESFTYGDKANPAKVNFDMNTMLIYEIGFPFSLGFFGKPSANLISSIEYTDSYYDEVYTSTYTWTTDSEGFATGVTINYDDVEEPSVLTVTYKK